MPYLIERLEIVNNPVVLFRGIVGSRAYGTQNVNSDTDVRGIFVVPFAEYARLAQPPKQVSGYAAQAIWRKICESVGEVTPRAVSLRNENQKFFTAPLARCGRI